MHFFEKQSILGWPPSFYGTRPSASGQHEQGDFSKRDLDSGQCGKDSHDKELWCDSEKQNGGCSEGDGESGKSVFFCERLPGPFSALGLEDYL